MEGLGALPPSREGVLRTMGVEGAKPLALLSNMRRGGRPAIDPCGDLLRLLPSGPDRVGRALVRRRPPARYIGCVAPEGKRVVLVGAMLVRTAQFLSHVGG